MCKAIGHPVRLQIVDLLSRYGGEVCVCDIESQFDLTQPTISHHLKTLRSAGVIDCEERGLWVYYFIKSGQIERLRNLLGDWLSQQAT
jgi:ArsR family transcriptional regulator